MYLHSVSKEVLTGRQLRPTCRILLLPERRRRSRASSSRFRMRLLPPEAVDGDGASRVLRESEFDA